ncbi:Hypothetical predicted protein [Paramuricea clavata]|uniref:Uncharacterized protein n=1 Tax=Paramuricea clavata TaxID=317549 RepID=A0A6S7I1X4_PARCT|nr:Hypothetical predicted protein [Paramuricea clavata]
MALGGLGEKTITFAKGGNSEHVHEKILEAYPFLANVGGYQILRTGECGNRQLIMLPIPPGGYTVAFLKSTLASAKGYIRPFQKEIIVDHGSVIGGVQSQISMSSKVECVNCHQIVAMDSMKMHGDVRGGGSSATLDESYRYCRQCCGDW